MMVAEKKSGHLKEIIKCRETICVNCPGTLWGKKSICRVHDKSIGLIDECDEWKRDSVPLQEIEQMELFDLEPVMEVIQRVEQELKDYNWMVREISRLERRLDDAIQSTPSFSGRLVAQYGIEAAMPKPQGKALASLTMEEKQFDRMVKRLEKLKFQSSTIDKAAESITGQKERTILECILDGVKMNETAYHVGVSRQRLNEIKHEVIRKMTWLMYGEELKKIGLHI